MDGGAPAAVNAIADALAIDLDRIPATPERIALAWGREGRNGKVGVAPPEVNGRQRSADVPPMKRLLDVLRGDFALTGTEGGCGEGECGACAVLVDGALVSSCLVAACQAAGTQSPYRRRTGGRERRGRGAPPIQQAFWERGGAQCGICTRNADGSGSCWRRTRSRPNPRSARRSPETSAAAPAT
jgi:hypothetical protein